MDDKRNVGISVVKFEFKTTIYAANIFGSDEIMYVTSFSVFHTEITVSIGLRIILRMVTSILQN